MLIGFRVDDERYALPAKDVTEVIPRVALRPVPLAPPCVMGRFAYRGQTMPVVDLGVLLRGTPSRDRMSTRIVVMAIAREEERRLVGFLAEKVADLEESSAPAIVDAGALLSEELWRTLFSEAGT